MASNQPEKGPPNGPSRRAGAGAPQGATYAVFAGISTLWIALIFYSSLRLQLFYSTVQGSEFLFPNDWSAPLDDVFIHFDFARAAARGHPFEWVEGNGYSSGGTSLLYPFVLAGGYLAGFTGTSLMVFAGVVACVGVLATLLGARRMFRDLPSWAAYLAPPLLLSIGALDWTLFSGMEVAFFLAVWAGQIVAWDDLVRGTLQEARPPRAPGWRALWLGLWGGVVVATRPEAAVLVAVLSLSAAGSYWRRRGLPSALVVLSLSALPGALVVVGQSLANLWLTGDMSAAGALVKLELHDPRLTAEQVLSAWRFHLIYQVARVTGYHVADNVWVGSILWVIAGSALLYRTTRRYALVLWASALLWIAVVALNGQVRWQNERYTMPAVAWLLLSAALGLGALLSQPLGRGRRGMIARISVGAAAVAAVVTLAIYQVPRFRGQTWFFGRASRNIRDQHIVAARKLRSAHPRPRRVLVGDAGAIPYVSDLPSLDIIGLGGYRDLPFARATRWGVSAAVELIERMPRAERPDVLAIYPTWWGDFPLWFGEPLEGVVVEGNVICGGRTKMIYRADWRSLDGAQVPAIETPRPAWIVDALDVADVVSERSHDATVRDARGFVVMKILPDPRRPSRGLFDAGRILPPGASIEGTLTGFVPNRPIDLVVRTAPSQRAQLRISADGQPVRTLTLEPGTEWREPRARVPVGRARRATRLRLEALEGEVIVYHLWGVQKP